MTSKYCVSLLIFIVVIVPGFAAPADTKPDVMLAEVYRQGVEVGHYWISEKYDGVRARWDGNQLVSRGGNVFAAPPWFTKDFPMMPLDGELWVGRGRYEEVSSIVRRALPHDGWRQIRFLVFDLPEHGGSFDQRVVAMRRLATQVKSPFLMVVEQQNLASEEALMIRLQAVIDKGGEGLILHRKAARYKSGRSHDLLKLKPFTDAEATVIGYRPGQGKFVGQVGSLKVRTDQGRVLYIGSGLSHEQRRNPPPLQSRITFRYQGLTKNGIPRFPRFLRIREEKPE
jgi:DNA ligase-1